MNVEEFNKLCPGDYIVRIRTGRQFLVTQTTGRVVIASHTSVIEKSDVADWALTNCVQQAKQYLYDIGVSYGGETHEIRTGVKAHSFVEACMAQFSKEPLFALTPLTLYGRNLIPIRKRDP